MRVRKHPPLPSKPVDYPSGTFIYTEKGYFYIASPGKRYRITTKRCLNSWTPQRVVLTSEAAVAKYKIAAKMKFRNGSLIHGISDGRIYLIENGNRRHIQSPDVLYRLGAEQAEAVAVSLDEINLHPEGEPIT